MKMTSDKWQVTSDTRKLAARGAHSCHPSPVTRHPERGIALVITLILLSVTLVMAVAFLALSNRERGAVATSTDTATARLAGDSALANAEGQIIANILSTTNPYDSSLLVSMNYLPVPFDPNNPATYTNISPRVPVLMTNLVTGQPEDRFYLDLNRNGQDDPSGYVVDVPNSNLVFEVGDPEWIGVLERPDEPYGPDNPALARYAFIAVPADNGLDLNYIHNQTLIPKWIDPVNPMSPGYTDDAYFRNQGVGTWELNLAAFLADLNTNEWGQIVGSYLNPTLGSASYYQYDQPVSANSGFAFEDAFSLLTNRYAGNYNTLAPLSSLGYSNYENGVIDSYTAGILMTNVHLDGVNFQPSPTPWAGSDNTNHFFDLTADLFDPAKSSGGATGFTNRLLNADSGTNTYDRYTFYRLLGEMGTDSGPESGKMNLNYDNLDLSVIVVGANTVTNPPSATNFLAWTPLGFFTNAADRMLRLYTTNWFESNPANYLATYYAANNYPFAINVDGFGQVTGLTNAPFFGVTNSIPAFGLTNIPVYVNGQFVYSPAVNRILQLAANMYDATVNSFYPDVFRPIFEHDNLGNVFIVGYTNISSASGGANTVSGTTDLQLSTPHDIADLPNLSKSYTPITDTNGYVNVFGVPWIIGAKKGLPNFNQFAMQNEFWIERKLQVTHPSPTSKAYKVSQSFIIGITNQLEVECWNSYLASYPNPVSIYVNDYMTVSLTNDMGYDPAPVSLPVSGSIQIPNPTNNVLWPGYNAMFPVAGNFQIPLNASIPIVSGELYRFNTGANVEDPGHVGPYLTTNGALPFETGIGYPQPNWGFNVTNNLRVITLDTSGGIYHVIDYVQLSGPNTNNNITQELIQSELIPAGNPPSSGLWSTNIYNTVSEEPWGVQNQITYSEDYTYSPANTLAPGDNGSWLNGTPTNDVLSFDAFMQVPSHFGQTQQNTNLTVQVPFTPMATIYQYTTWQANDPLVHYLASDLTDPVPKGNNNNQLITLNVNERYQPWGWKMLQLQNSDMNSYNPAFKDPLATNSDAWDFPENKFPTAGWLGRVHRGTPWQTVYLKSGDVWSESAGGIGTAYGHNTWMNWTGDQNGYDAAFSSPTNDWLLFDLFTTAPNDNATRGQLSVNVGANDPGDSTAGLAAWSALFSGIVVPTNSVGGYTVVSPAGLYDPASPPPLVQIVQGIYNTRTKKVNLDGVNGTFEHVGDILAVPQLTEQSPFLAPYMNSPLTNTFNDEMYEWLPQQVMSLVRVSNEPRYVIYCYGQTLKPAPGGKVLSGSNFGMITNYQVTAESAARAVIRVEGSKTTHPHIVIESFNLLPPDLK
jgi:hypothetical protein